MIDITNMTDSDLDSLLGVDDAPEYTTLDELKAYVVANAESEDDAYAMFEEGVAELRRQAIAEYDAWSRRRFAR